MTRAEEEPAAPEIVVLADLGVEPGAGTSRAEIGQPLFVAKGELGAALRTIRTVLSIELPPVREGPTQEDRSAAIPVRSARSLAPGQIATRIPVLARFLDLRAALGGLKNCLACVRALRFSFTEILGDAGRRRALRADLLLAEGAGIDAVAFVLEARSPRVVDALARLSASTDAPVARLLSALIDHGCMDRSDVEAVARCDLALRAFVLHLLHPDWIDVPVSAQVVRAMLEALDAARAPWDEALLHHAPTARLRRPLRGLEPLAADHAFTLVHCPRAALLARQADVVTAARRGYPRVICAAHEIDPRHEAGVLAAWADIASSVEAVFVADAPADLAGPLPLPISESWRALATPERAGRIALFPQRLSKVYAGPKPLRATEPDEPEAPIVVGDAGSVALLLAPWITSQEGPRGVSRPLVAGFDRILSGDRTRAIEELIGNRAWADLHADPPPPPGQSAERAELGLVDVYTHARGDEAPGLFVPRALLFRRRDGGFSETWPLAGLPAAAFTADEAQRRAFHHDGMSRCLRCGGPVEQTLSPEGARMNGDGHGTAQLACACGWSTSFRYDEAHAEDAPYFVETRWWSPAR